MVVNDLAPWLQAPMRRTCEALVSERLAHALLICGPAHIGKRAFADALTRNLLCRDRVAGMACGRCRDCALVAAGTHPDLRAIGLAENEKTGTMRKEIVIEQVRDLGAWFALTPQRGGAQVALIDPATAMNPNASNALLKTLEEPMPGRYLLMLCDSPMQLSATIRSRCQRIILQPPDTAAALDWLAGRGHGEALARSALVAARGHPGLAAHWIDAGLLALRDSVRSDLAAIAADRKRPLDVAAAWIADGKTEQRLAFAADLAVDLQARLQGAEPAAGNGEGWKLDRIGDPLRLGAWFDGANRTRDLLHTPIRADLAVAALLRDWRDALAA